MSVASTRADEHAIQALVGRYADAVNRRDPQAWAALWTEDGEWEAFGRVFRGRDAAVAAWTSAMERFGLVFHAVHPGMIEVDGDTARARLSVSEQLRSCRGAPGLPLALYHDRFRRESGAWRFARRRLQVIYRGPPDLSG